MALLTGNYGRVKPPVGAPLDRAHPLAQGLVGCWLFNEGGGAGVTNLVRAKKTALPASGLSWAAGGLGAGLQASAPGYTPTDVTDALTDFTCVVRFFADGSNPSTARLVDKAYNVGFWVGRSYSGANSWTAGVLEGAGPPYGTPITLADGADHQFAVARRGTLKSVYGDGVLAATATVSGAALSADPFTLFGTTGGAGNAFTGLVYEVYLYSRALSAAEIATLYAAPYQMFLLPRRALAAAASYVAAGAAQFTRTLTASQAQGLALVKAPAKVSSVGQPQATLLTRRAQAVRAPSQGQAATARRQAGKGAAASQGQGAALTRQAAKPLSAAQSQAAAALKAALRRLSAAQPQSPTVTALKVILRTLAAAQTQAASLARQAGKQLTAPQAQAAALSALRSLARALTAAQGQAAALTRLTARALPTAPQAQAATVAALKVILRALTATQGQAASLTRRAQKAASAAQAQAGALLRGVAKALPALSQAQSASLSALRALLRTLAATQPQAPTVAALKVILRTLAASQAQGAALLRQSARGLAAAQSQGAGLVKSARRSLSAAQAQGAALSALRVITRALSCVQPSAATLAALPSHIIVGLKTLLKSAYAAVFGRGGGRG